MPLAFMNDSIDGNNGNRKLDALLRKEAALKAAIAAAKVAQQKREAKDHERLAKIIGRALLANPDCESFIKEALQNASGLSDADRNFLKTHGWGA